MASVSRAAFSCGRAIRLIAVSAMTAECRHLAGRGVQILAMLTVMASPSARARASDEPAALSNYVVTTWTAKDGLPSDVIWSVTQDSEGYLWLGTNGGPVRFDGVRFVTVDTISRTAMPKAPARTVYAGRDGSVWIGFAETGGISRFFAGSVQNFGEREGLPQAMVLAMVETPEGTVWAGTARGLYTLSDARWIPAPPSLGLPEVRVDSLYVDRNGDLLVGTAVGVYRQARHGVRFGVIDALNDVRPTFRAFGEDAQGRVWMTDPEVGFRRLGEPTLPHPVAGRGRGNQLVFDREGSLWVATMGEGLWRVRLEGGGRKEVVEVTGISGARTLFEDRDGNIWTGSGEGLMRLRKPRVVPLTNLGLIEAVDTTPDGAVWAATADELIQFKRGPRAGWIQRRRPGVGRIRAISSNGRGGTWIATDAGLLRLSENEQWYQVGSGATILKRTNAMTADSRGGLWVSDREHGIFRWHPDRPEVFDPVPALAGLRVSRLYADSRDRLWFISNAGRLGMFTSEGTLRMFSAQDGLSSEILLTVYEDSSHVIWVGAFDGLNRRVGERFVRFDQANRFRGGVGGIVEDEEGDLWLATASGIVCVSRRALDTSLTDPASEVHTSLFDTADGTAGMPISFGGPSAVRARDGRLWFVTGRGLTSLEPSSLKQPRAPAHVKVESVHVDEQWLAAEPGVQLPARTDRLQIDYTALDLTTPLRTQFRYRLEGFDAEWIDAGTRRHALYTDLPPRAYRFHVVASTSDGSWSDASATWEFSIRPAFYQTTWFASLCVVAAGVATWALWRLRIRRIRRQFAMLLGERVRLSREIHDTLLQSLVGVALQFEAASNSLDDASPVREHLLRIRRQVEGYIREARQSIWNLRTPTLGPRDLAVALREAAERATSGVPVDIEFVKRGTPDRVPTTDTDEQLVRICQEAVLNAVRHGKATQVKVELRYDPGAIVLQVADNGCGFEPAVPQELGAAGHYGLLSMRERAEQVGGEFTLRSAVAAGTIVEARVPVRSERRRVPTGGPAHARVST